MSAPTESEILAALGDYRAHVNDVNFQAWKKIIPQIEAADLQEKLGEDEDQDEFKMEYINYNLRPVEDIQPPLKSPSEVIELGLRSNTERKKYKSYVLEKLNELECPTGEWEFPVDFGILVEHIDSLDGTGWGLQREMCKFIFWEGFENCSKYPAGKEIMKWIKDWDYEVAGGFEIWSGLKDFCYAIYSRSEGSDEWSCWYSVINHRYDNIVEVLNSYKMFNNPGDGEVEECVDQLHYF